MIQNLKKISLGYWLTFLILSVPFLFRPLYLYCNVHFSVTHRIVGVAAAILFVLMVKDRKVLQDRDREVRWPLTSLGIFFLITLVGVILNRVNPMYYYWGIRNTGRYFLFFFACIFFLKPEERKNYRKLLDALYYLNFLVTLYQFFVLGIRWDYLGGIFGVTIGTGGTNVFLLVIVIDSLVHYLHQREKGWICLAKCAIALIICALAEIKIFFVEFAAIVVLALIMTRFSWKKVWLLAGCAVGLAVSAYVLLLIYPGWASWFNPKVIWAQSIASTGYTGQGDFNRLNAIPRALNEFLLTGPQKLFGLGFGSCDYGPTGDLTPSFYTEYAHLSYTLLSSGFVMLETGILGSLAYLGFFAAIFFGCHSLERSGRGDAAYCQTGKLLALMCFVLYIYDCTLRTEPGYLIYFAMALPFLGLAKTE